MGDPSHQTAFPERHRETPFRTSSRWCCCSRSKASTEITQNIVPWLSQEERFKIESREERSSEKKATKFSYHFREHEGYYCGPYMYQKDQDEIGACDSSPARVRVSINRPHSDRRTEINQNTSLHESREVVNWVSERTFVGLSHWGHR